jgi:hypothetical protein
MDPSGRRIVAGIVVRKERTLLRALLDRRLDLLEGLRKLRRLLDFLKRFLVVSSRLRNDLLVGLGPRKGAEGNVSGVVGLGLLAGADTVQRDTLALEVRGRHESARNDDGARDDGQRNRDLCQVRV